MKYFKQLFIAVLIAGSQAAMAASAHSEASGYGSVIISAIVFEGSSNLSGKISGVSKGSNDAGDIPGEWQVTEMTTAENGKYRIVIKNKENVTATMFWDQQPKQVTDTLKVGDQVRFQTRKEGWILKQIDENREGHSLAFIPQSRFQRDLKSEKWTPAQSNN